MRHDAQPVAAPYLLNVALAVFAAQQLEGEVDHLAAVGQADDTTIAVEIGAQSDVVDAHHLDGMLEMTHGVEDGCLARLAEESGIEGDMGHTATAGECTQLVVGEIAGMVAQGAAVAMTAHDGGGTDVEGIVEALLAGMAQVDHDAVEVHLLDDALAELAHAIVGVAPAGRVADVVIAIMTERDVDDAPLSEVLHIRQVVVQGQTILNAQHDALAALALVLVKVGGGTGNAQITTVAPHNVLYLVENQVGIELRSYSELRVES